MTIPQEILDAWPKCAVPACQNKCCRRLESKYCWPHTPGAPAEAAENLRETEVNPLDELTRLSQEARMDL
jgi:hypothetical protein